MSADLQTYAADSVEAPLEYRALSTGAVASLVLGLASVFTIPAALTSLQGTLMLAPIPLAGLIVGVLSLLKIRRLPDELTGATLAMSGAVLSLAFLLGSLGLAGYVYATEVPEGYDRVTFVQMKPDEAEQRKQIVVPPDFAEFEGKPVFIKGYMRPPSQMFGLDSFLLVRDNNECCFGENLPKYFDRVQVHLEPPLRTEYSTRMYRVAGVLRIDPSAAGGDGSRPVFTLEADYLK